MKWKVGDKIILPSFRKLRNINIGLNHSKSMTGKKVTITDISNRHIHFRFENGNWYIREEDAIADKIDDWGDII